MKKWQTCLLGVGSICCLAACSAKNMSDESTMKEQTKTEQVSAQTATKGQAVADFELTGVDGKTYRLSDYKGKKVYLKFWASLGVPSVWPVFQIPMKLLKMLVMIMWS